jgi:hypothetical protein
LHLVNQGLREAAQIHKKEFKYVKVEDRNFSWGDSRLGGEPNIGSQGGSRECLQHSPNPFCMEQKEGTVRQLLAKSV